MNEVRVAHEHGNLYFDEPIVLTDDLHPLTEFIATIDKPILFFNVGSDRSLGDTYGPLIGTLLNEQAVSRFDDVAIMGTLDETVHATNLSEKIEEARLRFPNHVWIATDACLGKIESVGKTTLAQGMITPGAGVGKMLPPVGDYALTAVVNVGGFLEYFVLQTTRLSVVYELARRACDAIIAGLELRQERLETTQTKEEIGHA